MKLLLQILVVSTFIFIGCKGPQSLSKNSATTGDSKASIAFQDKFFAAQKQKAIGNNSAAYTGFAECAEIEPQRSVSYFEMAKLDHELGKNLRAIDLLEKALELEPQNTWYQHLMANVNMDEANYEQAEKYFSMLIESKNDDIDSYFDLAVSQLYQDKFKDAIETYDLLQDKVGISEELTVQKVKLFDRLGDNDKALLEFDQLIEKYPRESKFSMMKASYLRELGRLEEATKIYAKVAESEDPDPQMLIELSEFYAANGEEEKSFDTLQKAFESTEVNIDEKVAYLMRFISAAEFNPDMKSKCNTLLLITEQVHPNDPKAHAIFGDFLVQQRDYPEARTKYQRAIELDGSKNAIWSQLLNIDAQMGDWEALLTHSNESLEYFPLQPDFYLMNGLALLRLGKPKEALDPLKLGKSYVVDNPFVASEIHSNMGEAYHDLNEHDKSDEAYEKSLKLDGNNPYTKNNYAYFLSLRKTNLPRAKELIESALSTVPGSPSFLDTHAWILFQLGEYSEAKEQQLKAIGNEDTADSVMLEHLGDIYFHLNEPANAIEYWKKADIKGEGSSQLKKKISEGKYFDEQP